MVTLGEGETETMAYVYIVKNVSSKTLGSGTNKPEALELVGKKTP